MVVGSSNPIHSVLFLVLVFCNVSVLFILLGAEFLAMLFLIVYVGAIAVLFLFVVMMLPTHGQRAKSEDFSRYLPLGGFVGFILGFELFFVFLESSFVSKLDTFFYVNWFHFFEGLANTEVLGLLLYDEYISAFLLAGIILFTAMVGAIVLTMHRRGNVRRQEIYSQVSRNFVSSVSLQHVQP